MKENKLAELSMDFSVNIINLVEFLKNNHESIISNQIGRSETGYWLELLHRTKYIDESMFKTLSSKCTSLRVMLIASYRTAKEHRNR